MKERVQKLMAQAGIGSRRACEELIGQGRVRVNGKVITLGDKADPAKDTIQVDGTKLKLSSENKMYIALHKPIGVLSTSKTHRDDNRQMARDLLPQTEHLFPIGRLDVDSGGLMVFTNDGELTNELTHPRYRHTKTYRVVVEGLPTLDMIKSWEEGIYLPDLEDEAAPPTKTAPCSVKIIKGGATTVLRIVMTEGKKRQIRRIAAALGHPVKRLTRTHIGKLELGPMKPGEWRVLTTEEVALLKQNDEVMSGRRGRSARRPARLAAKDPTSSGRARKPTVATEKGDGAGSSRGRKPATIKRRDENQSPKPKRGGKPSAPRQGGTPRSRRKDRE